MIDWRTVDPTKLQPRFREDLESILQGSAETWVVTHGYRSLAEQAELWAHYQRGGPKAAPPGRSAHNFGLAVDVVLDGSVSPGLQPDWNTAHPGWTWLFDAVWQHPRLHSGRDFGDADHLEALGWKSLIPQGAIP